MSGKEQKTIIIDTNIVLHYKRLDQIDWLKEFDAGKVELLITPVVIEELEEHKVFNDKKKFRKRAEEFIKWFNSKITDSSLQAEIRSNVYLVVLNAEPSVDFAVNHLSKDMKDDRLIAHLIEQQNSSPNINTIILTADTGIRMKAIGRKLPLIFWDGDKYRRTDEQDPVEKKYEELQRENLQLKNRIPDLSIQFDNGTRQREFVFAGLTPSEIKAELDRVWTELRQEWDKYDSMPKIPFEGASVVWDAEEVDQINHNEYMEYDMKARRYYGEYENYLKALSEHRAHAIQLDLILANTGTCVADDIHLMLQFPEGIDIRLSYDPPEEPEPPKLLKPGESYLNQMLNLVTPHMPPMVADSNVNRPNMPKPGEITYEIKRVMHNLPVPLPPVYIIFDDTNHQPRSFKVEYSLFSKDIPIQVTGKLDLIITVNTTQES